MFSTAWNGEHIGGILKGMRQKIKETNNDLYIFNTYGGFEAEQEYNECEYSIFHLPLASDIDGMVMISNNMDSISRLTPIIETCRERKIPCISVEMDIPGVHFIGTDNYSAMEAIVEHLVTVHGCRTFNYVGGPSDHIENCQRKQAFCDVLSKHGIVVEEARIRDYDFSRNAGKQAFLDFDQAGMALPDAVVCANDNMAIGYMDMMESRGLCVPKDTIVTGFDNLFESKCHDPGIASVGRSKENLGEISIEQILGMIDGKDYPRCVFAPFEFQADESCGCSACVEKNIIIKRKMSSTFYQNQQIRWRMNLIQKRLLACQTVMELNKTIYEQMQDTDIRKFAILLNEDEYLQYFTLEAEKKKRVDFFSENMRVLFQAQSGRGVISSGRLETVQLIPQNFCTSESDVFIFMPLHLNGIKYVYCVLGDQIDYIENENLFYWISMMNLVVDNVRQNISIRLLNNKLSRMYMQDAMPGQHLFLHPLRWG
ncbi:LacI family DNA-binding transcriptional regulator [Frisingicoccus sp.]|uniref:LacI family DNA-binding transcriptional regulator n=1 Tax=Frisingicoccus sp. TaxID=1918627 RepID=UPI002A7F2067|nr:LacI family DNA-binding transcriptional regulator [Frisingicoccus sp.]